MDSKSEMIPARYDDKALIEFVEDEAFKGVPISIWTFENVTKQADEQMSNSRDSDFEQMQHIWGIDHTTNMMESVQVPAETEEASNEEADSAAQMAKGDLLSTIETGEQLQAQGNRIYINPDDHHMYSGLAEITSLPAPGNSLQMPGRKISAIKPF